ncbi:MAG: protein kinase [Pseudonocardiaceae bacterium]|nr:protein kinase [Pseudonocardiaceae bacterium]
MIAERYRLRGMLGHGSMGTVWSGYDEVLHRPVAVKEVRLPPDFPAARAGEVRERALREARAIAVLSHPNVITVHDIAREQGEPFVVMELLPSRSLAAILRTHGALSVTQTAAVADAVAAALEAAHHAGITHRDVKPGNVLVAESATSYSQARIKLTDFGIARNMAEVSMTRTGIMLGSPAYIAPEVASGQETTPAADLWSLGATMFAAVEGRAPFDANGDAMETVLRVVHGDVPSPTPGPLAPLIEALMVKDPAKRMPLLQLRRSLYPLLPEPGTNLFSESMFTDELPAPSTAAPDPSSTQIIPPERSGVGGRPEAGSEAAELASDPGPLPFTPPPRPTTQTPSLSSSPPVSSSPSGSPVPPVPPRPPRPRRRSAAATVALIIGAVLLFAAAGAGGFAAARAIGRQPLLPPAAAGGSPETVPSAEELTTVNGTASTINGAPGGAYTLRVPAGWRLFRSQQPGSTLPTSSTVQYVSPDGAQALTVEHFADFYAGYSIDDYRSALGEIWPGQDLRFRQDERLSAGPSGAEPARELRYRTVERAQAGASGQARTETRATFARATPAGDELWVLSVTVPADRAEAGRQLYDLIARTLRPHG